MSSRSESVRGLMPGHAFSSCMKRRGPSDRSWTISGVHLVAMISAVAATAQFPWSWMSFIVLLMARILLPLTVRRYRKGSGALSSAFQTVEPHRDFRGALPALVDCPDDQLLAPPRIAGGKDAVDPAD